MWKIFLGLAIIAFVMQQASAETSEFYEAPQILDNGQLKDYILTQNATHVKLETNNSGGYVFDKAACSYDLHGNGIINGRQPAIDNISWYVRGKDASAQAWSNIAVINNSACVITIDTAPDSVRLVSSKTASVGTFQLVLTYRSGDGIKETVRGYNNNPAWNNHHIGFEQVFNVPRIIHFGKNQYDLANHDGTILGRNWITNNNATLIRLTQKLNYDFGVGFNNLDNVKINWNGTHASLQMRYLFTDSIVPYQKWFEVDPTFNFDTAGAATLLNLYSAQSKGGQLVSSTSPRGYTLSSVTFRVFKTGSPTGNVYAELLNTSTDTVLATSDIRDASTLPTSAGNFQWNFTTYPIIPNQNFRIALVYTGGDAGNRIDMVGSVVSTVPDQQFTYYTGVWTNLAQDLRGFFTYNTSPRPWAVTNLNATVYNNNNVQLNWTATTIPNGTLAGYMINYTTPHGNPQTKIINNTGTAVTTYNVLNLNENTPYSFRVGPWNQFGINGSGKIANVTTSEDFTSANFTIGNFDFNATNPNLIGFIFERDEINSTHTFLNVTYPKTYTTDCTFRYRFAGTSSEYLNVSGTSIDAIREEASFRIINSAGEVITVKCVDRTTNDTGRYVLTQDDFMLKQQVKNFRNGVYGTDGQFGAFDLLSIIAVILAMIGLNRVNSIVGVLTSVFMIGALAYFEIITWPSIVFAAIAVIVMVAIIETRKD